MSNVGESIIVVSELLGELYVSVYNTVWGQVSFFCRERLGVPLQRKENESWIYAMRTKVQEQFGVVLWEVKRAWGIEGR